MPETTAVIDSFYDAWNRYDVAGTAILGVDGGYADPFTADDLRGDALIRHLRAMQGVLFGMLITPDRVISCADAAAVTWTLTGTWDGQIGGIRAGGGSGRPGWRSKINLGSTRTRSAPITSERTRKLCQTKI
jgi:hypothetical protein